MDGGFGRACFFCWTFRFLCRYFDPRFSSVLLVPLSAGHYKQAAAEQSQHICRDAGATCLDYFRNT